MITMTIASPSVIDYFANGVADYRGGIERNLVHQPRREMS